MKRILSCICAIVMVLTLAACGQAGPAATETETTTPAENSMDAVAAQPEAEAGSASETAVVQAPVSAEVNEEIVNVDGITVRLLEYTYSPEQGLTARLEIDNLSMEEYWASCEFRVILNNYLNYKTEYTGGPVLLGLDEPAALKNEATGDEYSFGRIERAEANGIFTLAYQPTTDATYRAAFPIDPLVSFSIACRTGESEAWYAKTIYLTQNAAPEAPEGVELYTGGGVRLVSMGYVPESKVLLLAASADTAAAEAQLKDYHLNINYIIDGIMDGERYGSSASFGLRGDSALLSFGFVKLINHDTIVDLLYLLGVDQPTELSLFTKNSADEYAIIPVPLSTTPEKPMSTLEAYPILFESEEIRLRKISDTDRGMAVSVESSLDKNLRLQFQTGEPTTGDAVCYLSGNCYLPPANALGLPCVFELTAYESMEERESSWEHGTTVSYDLGEVIPLAGGSEIGCKAFLEDRDSHSGEQEGLNITLSLP